MSAPGGRGGWKISGKRDCPSSRGRVKCARASMGRCFVMEGQGTREHQSREG